jgi:uncharacterized protein (DUF2147 family)
MCVVYGTKLQTEGRFDTWFFHAILQSLVAFAVICLSASAPALANAELGTWLNNDRKGKIVLRECGENSLCGQLVWLKDPVDEKGKPWLDQLNPDPKLRGRTVVGVDVLIGTKKIGPNTWQGQIYDPEVGKVYYLKHLKVGKDRVEIKGCLSTGWPCRTKYWTRTEPLNPPAPIQIAKRNVPPIPIPRPAPGPRTAPPRVAPPVAVAPPPQVAPPVQPQIPYPSQPPQARAPVPPAPVARPAPPPDVTAAFPRPAVSPSQGGYLVQVAARQSRNDALQAFNELQRRYPQLLGKLRPEVLRADLGQRGIWFRVGIGPVAEQSAALNFCQRLKAVGADCLIRRR